MAKQIKKVALLKDDSAGKKMATESLAKKPLSQKVSGSAAAANQTKRAAKTTSVASRLMQLLMLCLLLVLLLLPKPQLLHYQKMNIATTSLYWPGVFGLGAGLSDSDLKVYLDEQRNELNLCYQDPQNQQCSSYKVLHRGGLVEVIQYLLK